MKWELPGSSLDFIAEHFSGWPFFSATSVVTIVVASQHRQQYWSPGSTPGAAKLQFWLKPRCLPL